jgi:hypothetical protein
MAMPRELVEEKKWKGKIKIKMMNEQTLELANNCTKPTRGVSHCDLAIYIKKGILKAKEELWKLKYFTMQKI